MEDTIADTIKRCSDVLQRKTKLDQSLAASRAVLKQKQGELETVHKRIAELGITDPSKLDAEISSLEGDLKTAVEQLEVELTAAGV